MKAFQVLNLGATVKSRKEEKQKAVVEKNYFELESQRLFGSIYELLNQPPYITFSGLFSGQI